MKYADNTLDKMFDAVFQKDRASCDVVGVTVPRLRAVEGYSVKNGDLPKGIDKASLGDIMDCSKILPFAAEALKISPRLEDYIIQPIEIIRSEIPNRNGTGFLYEELTRFNPEYGRIAYQTWIGMPTFVEHQDNRKPELAAGIILDVALRKADEFKGRFYRLNQLLAYDRNKRSDIASAILRGDRASFSMGSMCNYYTCSICNANVNDMGGYCEHIDVRTPKAKAMSMQLHNGKLAYCQPRVINGIETSSVMVPAASFATNPKILMTPSGA
jgi:hypothetical protein